jgi:hypothetical protein
MARLWMLLGFPNDAGAIRNFGQQVEERGFGVGPGGGERTHGFEVARQEPCHVREGNPNFSPDRVRSDFLTQSRTSSG